MKFNLCLGILLSCCLLTFIHCTIVIDKLTDYHREQINVRIPMNLTERLIFMKNIRNIFEVSYIILESRKYKMHDSLFDLQVYPNREAKMSYYAMEAPNIDPLPKISSIYKRLTSLTDDAFHDAIADVFRSLRDVHLVYFSPGKNRCYTVYSGLVFDLAQGQTELVPKAIVVKKMNKFASVLGQNFSLITKGDELLEFDNKPLLALAEELKSEIQGANDDGKMRRLLDLLSVWYVRRRNPPKRNTYTLKMRSINDGKDYKITMPWAVEIWPKCGEAIDRKLSQLTKKTISGRNSALAIEPPKLVPIQANTIRTLRTTSTQAPVRQARRSLAMNIESKDRKDKQNYERFVYNPTESKCNHFFVILRFTF
jgi:hypothetical protein